MSQTLPLQTRSITEVENRWGDVREFLAFLTTALTVRVPDVPSVSAGISFPIGGNRPILFLLLTTTGDFSGLYAFVAGEYRLIAGNIAGEIRGIASYTVGTTLLPFGWHLADGTNGTVNRSSHFSGASPNFGYAEIQYTGAA